MKMNRERITIVLLLALLAFCGWALNNTVTVSREMSTLTDEAISMTDMGRADPDSFDALGEKLGEISRRWEECEPVVSTYSRHDELERVSSAVRKLRPLYESKKPRELYLTLNETRAALDHLKKTELPTIANIL